MKKIVAALLVVCIFCVGLVGCAGTPKEISPYFPHSTTLRLDASVDEVVKSDGLVHQKDLDGNELEFYYEKAEPVMIDEKQFEASCGQNKFDEITYIYTMPSGEGKNFSKEHEELVKYFSKIYGKGEDSTSDNSEFQDIIKTVSARTWKFKIDSGIEYVIRVDYSRAVNNPDSFLQVAASRSET